MRCFVVAVGGLIAPRVVHRHAEFPVFRFGTHHRYALLRRGIVAIALDAAVDDAVWSIAAQQMHDVGTAPGGSILFPIAVKPPQVGAVGAREFFELRKIKAAEASPSCRVILDGIARGGAGEVGIVRMRPVE